MTAPTIDIPAFLADVKSRVDPRLDELLAENGSRTPDAVKGPGPTFSPRRVHECMRYSVLDGGKRVRPALMAAVAQALGARMVDHLDAMCAVEMIHVCSLILDDLPSMDDAELRHGRKANHLVFGEAVAILGAIALLNRAFEVLSESCPDDSVRRSVIAETARMVGTEGMIGGQVVDLESGGKAIDARTLEYIEAHKTGALIIGAARIAAVLAGATPEQLGALTGYARNVGVAYQICDDILHLTRAPGDLGKVSHRDESTINYARAHGLAESRRSLESFTAAAVDALSDFGPRADHLRALARYLAERAS